MNPSPKKIAEQWVEAARTDEPSEAELSKLAARLGLRPDLPFATSAAPPEAQAPPMAGSLGSAKGSALWLVAKSVAVVGALGAAAVMTSVVFPEVGTRLQVEPQPVVRTEPELDTLPPALPEGKESTEQPEPRGKDEGTSRPPRRRLRPAARPPEPTETKSDLVPEVAEAAPKPNPEEVRLLVQARAFENEVPERALALTEIHAKRFRESQLAQEREAIAIAALARLGHVEMARSRAMRFRARWPGSPHRERIDHLLETLDAKTTEH